MLLIAGLVIGVVVGVCLAKPVNGCGTLLLVPFAMIIYVYVCQRQHPENLTSTIALDYIFGPLWPSIGAVVGFAAGKLICVWADRRSNRRD